MDTSVYDGEEKDDVIDFLLIRRETEDNYHPGLTPSRTHPLPHEIHSNLPTLSITSTSMWII